MPENYSGYQIVEPNYIIIRCTDLQNDKVSLRTGHVNHHGIISGAYLGFKPNDKINSRFYHFLLHTWDVSKEIYRYGSGLRQSLSWNDIKYLLLAIPPKSEQEAIVEYLDKVTGEIDRAIESQQKMIDALNERKQIIITRAVTRGLNPEAPLRDSGIDWLGQIPAHWEILKFKNVACVKANLVHPNDYLNYPQISPDCIEKGTGKILGFQTVRDSGIISDNHLFFKGQILYSKIRPTLNKVTIAPYDGLCSADMYPIETSDSPEYLLFVMLSKFFSNQISTAVAGRVKMPKINKQELGSLLMPVPPIYEQRQIVGYIERIIKPISSAISNCERMIALLTERKQIIINEVVTGKKKVI